MKSNNYNYIRYDRESYANVFIIHTPHAHIYVYIYVHIHVCVYVCSGTSLEGGGVDTSHKELISYIFVYVGTTKYSVIFKREHISDMLQSFVWLSYVFLFF